MAKSHAHSINACRSVGAILAASIVLSGCTRGLEDAGRLDQIWGRRGLMPGQMVKPRAIAIDEQDDVFLVDRRAKMQVYDPDGEFLREWDTPTHEYGRPSGLAFDHDQNLLVADSHYHRVLKYDRQGKLLHTIGGDSELDPATDTPLDGVFGYVCDVAVDSQGHLFVAESQQEERISKLDPTGAAIVIQWGGRGPAPGQFQRIRALDFDDQDRLYVADACKSIGELSYPDDVAVAPDQTI